MAMNEKDIEFEKALEENMDIVSSSQLIETEKNRVMVKNTDNGKRIMEEIDDLYELLELYKGRNEF